MPRTNARQARIALYSYRPGDSGAILSWELLLLSFAAVPLILLLVSIVGKPVQGLTARQNEALGTANVITQDAVSGQVEVKAFGLQSWMKSRHDVAVDGWVREGEATVKARVRMAVTNDLNVLVPILIMGGMGAVFVLNGRMISMRACWKRCCRNPASRSCANIRKPGIIFI